MVDGLRRGARARLRLTVLTALAFAALPAAASAALPDAGDAVDRALPTATAGTDVPLTVPRPASSTRSRTARWARSSAAPWRVSRSLTDTSSRRWRGRPSRPGLSTSHRGLRTASEPTGPVPLPRCHRPTPGALPPWPPTRHRPGRGRPTSATEAAQRSPAFRRLRPRTAAPPLPPRSFRRSAPQAYTFRSAPDP